MRKSGRLSVFVSLVSMLCASTSLADVDEFSVAKIHIYRQTSQAPPTTPVEFLITSFVDASPGDTTFVTLNGLPLFENYPGSWDYDAVYSSLAAFDGAWPPGTIYDLDLLGGILGAPSESILLGTPEVYPLAPVFTPASFLAIQSADHDQDLLIEWLAPDSNTTTTFLAIYGTNPDAVVFDMILPSSQTSFTVPAGLLEENVSYELDLAFGNLSFFPGQPAPGGFSVGAQGFSGFASETQVFFQTDTADELDGFAVVKGASFVQTLDDTQPSQASSYRFGAFVDAVPGGATSASVTVNFATTPLGGSGLGSWENEQGFGSKGLLDGAYPSGAFYDFHLEGGSLGTRDQNLFLGADDYPAAPYLVNGGFSQLQSMDPGEEQVLQWAPASGDTTLIAVVVVDASLGQTVLADELLPSATSWVIPADALVLGNGYQLLLEFVNTNQSVGDPVPGFGPTAIGNAGFYTNTSVFFSPGDPTQPCIPSEVSKLLASDGADSDELGSAASISGNVALVGAPRDDNANGSDAGAAYLYRFDGAQWLEESQLVASDGAGSDVFGHAVALSGQVAVVGAFGHDIFGGEGAAYVFRFNGSQWVEEAKLLASDGLPGDAFGNAVAIDGDLIVVGASFDDGNYTNTGSAYVFRHNGSQWVEEDKFTNSNGWLNFQFGHSVAVSGDTVLVGEWNGTFTGVAYVFRDYGNWVLEDMLQPTCGGQNKFGWAVALDGDTALVGGPGTPCSGWVETGAAWVFERQGTSWNLEPMLTPSDGAAGHGFGSSVAIRGDKFAVGAPGDDSNGFDAGSAYLFRHDGLQWVHDFKLLPSDQNTVSDAFGSAVALTDGLALVGAYRDDENGSNAGAAYLFDYACADPLVDTFCAGDGSTGVCPCAEGEAGAGCASSSTSGATLVATGSPSFAADSFGLAASGLPAGKPGLCMKGSAQANGGAGLPIGDGILCMTSELRSQVIVSDAGGNLSMPDWRGQPFGTYPGAANVGAETYYQWWYRDPQNSCSGSGFNFSNGLKVSWQ